MKLKSLLLAAASMVAMQSNAQWTVDTITMANIGGTTFANDVYYHMGTGTAKIEANNNWHIAFVGGAMGRSVSVIANHAGGNVNVYSLNIGANGKFGTDITADTVGKHITPLYNSLETWDEGAFLQNSSGGFNYGWGEYDMNTHNITGDSLYLVELVNGVGAVTGAYQLWIEENISAGPNRGWKFHVSGVDGSNIKDENLLVAPTYGNKLFMYYDIVSNTIHDREPVNNLWDFVFTRYKQDAGGGMMYPYTGILSNEKQLIAELRNVWVDTAEYRGYAMDSLINVIGDDWKLPFPPGPPPTQYDLDTSVTYFVTSQNNSIYQLQLTYATTGGGGAMIGLRKRLAVYNPPTSVSMANASTHTMSVFPNPATISDDANLLITLKKGEVADLVITDMTGRIMLHNKVALKDGLNALKLNTSAYAAGNYIISLGTGNWKMTEKLAVQH